MVLYTAVGGLKATFLTDFLHTAIALILIIYFTIAVLTNSAIGGLGGLWEKVMATAEDNYVPGNYEGSLLTFKSKDAIIWELILKFGNLALVVMVRSFHGPRKKCGKDHLKLGSTYRRWSYEANIMLIGHRVLAKVLRHGGQCYSAGV